MVNEPGKLTATQRAREKEQGAGQFAIPQGEGEENYEQLLDQYGARKFAEGVVMKGTVLKITDTDVVVDIGYKSEGVIPVAQFIDPNGHVTIKVGDVIDVLLEDTEDGDGHIVLGNTDAFNAGGTGYPRHLVTHNPCLPRLGTSRNRGPPEALIVAPERLAHTRFHRALAGPTGPPTPT